MRMEPGNPETPMTTRLATARSTASLRLATWGGLSSMLRPAARAQRTAGQRSLWQRLARAMRSAGADHRSRPLHALLGNVECVRGSDSGRRLQGG